MRIQTIRDDGRRLREVAEFMARLNAEPRHRIGYCDETPEGVLSSFSDFGQPAEDTFLVARRNGHVCGVVGFEADPEVGRAWIWGPFIDDGEWHSVGNEMWTALAPTLPDYVAEIEMFYDVHNLNCDEFARERGFEVHKDDVSILELSRAGAPEPATAEELPEHLHAPLAKLHERLFPKTYLPSKQLLDSLDDMHRVLVVSDGNTLHGYAYATIYPDAGEAMLDYVGVVESERDRGVASRLVRAIVAWAFSVAEVRSIGLTVDSDNAAARHLYARLGFRHLFDARGMRRPWGE